MPQTVDEIILFELIGIQKYHVGVGELLQEMVVGLLQVIGLGRVELIYVRVVEHVIKV